MPSLAMTTFLLSFEKGKRACWKIEKNPKFIEIFASLGSSWNLQDEVYDGLEEYRLYGYKKKMSIMSVINYLNVHILEKIR